MGKSWLLKDLIFQGGVLSTGTAPTASALSLWDLPHAGPTSPLKLPRDGTRLVIATRPGTRIEGLARAELYGHVDRIAPEALLFSEADLAQAFGASEGHEIWMRTGGWPCLIGVTGAEGGVSTFLEEEVLSKWTSAELVALSSDLNEYQGARLQPPARAAAMAFAAPNAELLRVVATVRGPLVKAAKSLLGRRVGDPSGAYEVANAYLQLGNAPEAVTTFQGIGAWEAALAAMDDAGGPFFGHRFGSETFDAVLRGFPPNLSATDDLLILCQAVQATKRGEVLAAHHLLAKHWGEEAIAAPDFVAHQDRYALTVRFFRFILQSWEDFEPDASYFDRAYALLAELPGDDDLRRGSLYNAVLDVYVRARRFAEAEDVAIRAAQHYARAGLPVMSFYIDLHRAIVALFRGEPNAARHHAASAWTHLDRVPFDSPGDARLLSLVDAFIEFEAGRAAPLALFLMAEMDAFAAGEIWPSLVELALTYGAQALAEHYATAASRTFLDRWRMIGARSSQFRRLIDLREVAILQSGNRWKEAASLLAALQVGSAQHGTATLSEVATRRDRDEVSLTLLMLRHRAHATPSQQGLADDLARALENRHLTARQRIGAEIWLAHVLRRSGEASQAQTLLTTTLERVAGMGCLAVLGEERTFLADLLANARVRATVERSDAARRLLRRVQGSAPSRGVAAGLTRQEARVLHALCEGASNKAIANALGLSEPTVKFHLSSIYRKLGCRTRLQAQTAAAALSLTR